MSKLTIRLPNFDLHSNFDVSAKPNTICYAYKMVEGLSTEQQTALHSDLRSHITKVLKQSIDNCLSTNAAGYNTLAFEGRICVDSVTPEQADLLDAKNINVIKPSAKGSGVVIWGNMINFDSQNMFIFIGEALFIFGVTEFISNFINVNKDHNKFNMARSLNASLRDVIEPYIGYRLIIKSFDQTKDGTYYVQIEVNRRSTAKHTLLTFAVDVEKGSFTFLNTSMNELYSNLFKVDTTTN